MVSCHASQKFSGDGDVLVDKLIAASYIQPVSARTAQQHWVDRELEKWCDESLPHVALEPLETTNRLVSEGPKFSHGKRARTGRVKSPRSAVRSAGNMNFACPALASAPKPSELPLPRTLLRGRSPSPPKDMFMCAFQMQHLLPPIAA